MNNIQSYGITAKPYNNINTQKKQNVSFGVQLMRQDIQPMADFATRYNKLPELYTMLKYLKELPGQLAKLVKVYGPKGSSLDALFELQINDKKVSDGFGPYGEYSCCTRYYQGLPSFMALQGCTLEYANCVNDGFHAIAHSYSDDFRKMPDSVFKQEVWENRNVGKRDVLNLALEGEIMSTCKTWSDMSEEERGFVLKGMIENDELPGAKTFKCDLGSRYEVYHNLDNGGYVKYFTDKSGNVDKMVGYIGPAMNIQLFDSISSL